LDRAAALLCQTVVLEAFAGVVPEQPLVAREWVFLFQTAAECKGEGTNGFMGRARENLSSLYEKAPDDLLTAQAMAHGLYREGVRRWGARDFSGVMDCWLSLNKILSDVRRRSMDFDPGTKDMAPRLAARVPWVRKAVWFARSLVRGPSGPQ
jgi:hypothetical protein